MNARTRLSNRRSAETFSFNAGGLQYIATISKFSDARIAEIFLNNHRSNSSADVNARDAAIAVSLALKFGADLETIRKALGRDANGKASGVLGAALDLIAGETS